MVKLGGEFDATRIEPSQPFEVLPAGKYLVQVVDSDERATKEGTGTYLWFEFDVLDGDHTGRKLWARINRENPKQKAVEIGEREFSALCHAAGKLRVSDTIELHNIPVIVTVQVRPATPANIPGTTGYDPDKPVSNGYSESNAIRGYERAGGARAARGAATAPTHPGTAAVATPVAPPASAPWKHARG